jgi:excisionase family DNA binding protein
MSNGSRLPDQASSAKPGKPARPATTVSTAPSLKDQAHESRRPMTTSEVAKMIGMSATFVRKEISSGYLRAIRIGRGRKSVFRIPVSEVRRYIKTLGLL